MHEKSMIDGLPGLRRNNHARKTTNNQRKTTGIEQRDWPKKSASDGAIAMDRLSSGDKALQSTNFHTSVSGVLASLKLKSFS
jgi:hypothetical protein